jgi:membrane protein
MKPRQIVGLLKEAATSWSEDSAPSMGAAISYYSVFSMAPLLVIVIAVAGFFFGADQVQGALSAQLTSLMGEDAARAVDEMLKNAQQPKTGGIAAITSAVVLVIGATTVLAELQNALDRIWRVPAREQENGLWRWLRRRLLTLAMVLAIAFLLIVSLIFSAALAALGKWWGPLFGAWERLAYGFDLLVSFTVLTLAFAMIYKFLPRAHIRWHDVWIGAAVTSVLFALGKFLIGLYLGKSDVASGFGLFGSLALMMVWIYYSAQIFLFGAEFTWVFANRYGSRRATAGGPTAGKPVPDARLESPESGEAAAPAALPASRAPHAAPPRRPGLVLTGALLAGAILAKLAERAPLPSLRRTLRAPSPCAHERRSSGFSFPLSARASSTLGRK